MPRERLPRGEWGKISRHKLPDGRWAARARMRDLLGRDRQIYASAPTGPKAERALISRMQRYLLDQSSGEFRSTTPLRVVGDAWFEHVSKQGKLGGNTLYQHRLRLNNHIYPRLGDIAVGEVTVGILETTLKSLAANSGPDTARTVRTTLCLLFDFCERSDLVTRNVARRTSSFGEGVSQPKAISLEGIRELLSGIREFNDADDYARRTRTETPVADIVWTMVGTGMRAGEVIALNWGDLELSHTAPSKVHIARTVTIDSHGHRHIGNQTKTGVVRTLTLPAFAEEILLHRRDASLDVSRSAPVFTNKDGSRAGSHTLYYQWNRFREQHDEFDWVVLHTLRKSVATLIAEAHGAATAARQLGHSSVTTTLRYYIERTKIAPDSSDVFDQMVIAMVADDDPI